MGDIEKSNNRLPWRRGDRRPRGYQPGPFALVYAALLTAGVVASAAVYYVLVHHVPGMAANRADTVKTALLVIGGSGALAGLYVSYRKQRTDEANHLRDQDKLFTERYTAAAAQLGNDKAAVRLAGIYALARIADDSVRDRPTCMEVLCAYLRMPYDPNDSATEPAERQVRIAAQVVIGRRLRPDHPGFWSDAQVDFTGAHLITLNFHGVKVAGLTATDATFSGRTDFSQATFELARFNKAMFEFVLFDETTFHRFARFREATFSGESSFHKATFSGNQSYDSFEGAMFRGLVLFSGVTFNARAPFSKATFGGEALFSGATFGGDAEFREATFDENANFDKATFGRNVEFSGATFRRDLPLEWPDGFAEPTGIVWTGPGPSSISADPPTAP